MSGIAPIDAIARTEERGSIVKTTETAKGQHAERRADANKQANAAQSWPAGAFRAEATPPADTGGSPAPLTATQQLIVRTLKDMEDRLLRRRDLEFLRQMNRKQVTEELADVLLLSEIICCWDSGAGQSHPDDTCLIQAIREIAIPAEA